MANNPFEFYGDGYFDESTEMFYEARFETFIDFVDRPPLADPFEHQISMAAWDDVGCRLECAPWVWAADWVLLRFRKTGPRVSQDDFPSSTIINGIFTAVHLVRPLLEVVCLNTPSEFIPPWGRDQGDGPSPAPNWNQCTPIQVGGSKSRRRRVEANDDPLALPNGIHANRERFEAEAIFYEDFEAERRKHRRFNDEDMGR